MSGLKGGRGADLAYWIPTALVALNWTIGGANSVMRTASAMEVFHRLGYPDYFASMLGGAQLLGVAAILAPVPRLLREWAYAGLFFDVAAAAFSLIAAGLPPSHLIFPAIAAALLLASHSGWRARIAE